MLCICLIYHKTGAQEQRKKISEIETKAQGLQTAELRQQIFNKKMVTLIQTMLNRTIIYIKKYLVKNHSKTCSFPNGSIRLIATAHPLELGFRN